MLRVANQNSAGLRIECWGKAEINSCGNRMRGHARGAICGLGLRAVCRIGRMHVNHLRESEYSYYQHKEQCRPTMDVAADVLAVLFHIVLVRNACNWKEFL